MSSGTKGFKGVEIESSSNSSSLFINYNYYKKNKPKEPQAQKVDQECSQLPPREISFSSSF